MNWKQRSVQLLVLAAIAITTMGCPPTNLQVRRFTTAVLNDARADAILGDMGAVLIVDDGPGDVACGAAFVRDGLVTSFATGDGSIDSLAELNAVLGLPGYVKVVNAINWCGGFGVGIIGCAPVPGNSLTVVRFTANLEGILWAHEYGHTRGLSHRNNVNAVMNPFIVDTARRVNDAECNAIKP